ncbi:DUF2922 domain-containing protein [Lentibacillus amyloliquefaciens]|uniref:DUF2922 domain-containing protein n=1 Tax=Lentibacillus amyloliquefaciens TaxID=1472767 RepID=UPI002FF49834
MKKLELKFWNEDDKTVTCSLRKPIEPPNPAAIKGTMDEIINQNAFISFNRDIVSIKKHGLLNGMCRILN